MTTLLGDVDRAVFSAAFIAALRKAGMPVSIHSAERLADAFEVIQPTARTELYWLCRVTLVHDVRSIDTFDRVFDVVFEGGALPTGRDARKSNRQQQPPPVGDEEHHRLALRNQAAIAGGGVPWSSTPSAAPESVDEPHDLDEIVLPELLPSALADVADTPFDQLNDDELAAIGRFLDSAIIHWPMRPVRRTVRARHPGTLDRRRTLGTATRTGGDPYKLVWRTQLRRPRKVAMIADVSGSMQTFVRPYMHVMRSLSTHVDAESWAFSTSVTRLTPALRRGDPADAIAAATELVDDRFTGTRIAHSLRTLMSHSSWSTALRGAVVLIASDGWDTDDPQELARAMARLERMANRIVWVNPRAAAVEFEPLVGGMAAALPHCSTMLSGHTLRAMFDVLLAMGTNRRPATAVRPPS